MKRWVKLLVIVSALPLLSWGFLRFVYYPVELERHAHGPYTVIALAEPTTPRWNVATLWVECTGVTIGSISDYTQIRVELRKDGKLVDSSVLVSGEDLPGDHMPLRVQWESDSVAVVEQKRSRTATSVLTH